MATCPSVPDRLTTGNTLTRNAYRDGSRRRRVRSLILPSLVLTFASATTLPAALVAQDAPPAPSEEAITVSVELREAMERLRSERATVMELMQQLRETDQAALRDFMREFQGEGILQGLQQQRRQGADGPGMQPQRRQGADGPGMQQQRRQPRQGLQQGHPDPERRGQRPELREDGGDRPGPQQRMGIRRGDSDTLAETRGRIGRTADMPGVRLHPLNPDLGRYFEAQSGILVLERHEDSFLPVEAGDVIVTVDGREMEDQPHLRRILMSYQPGDTFALEVVRQGRRLPLEVEVPAAGPNEG